MCVFRAIKCGSFLYKISGSASFTVLKYKRLIREAAGCCGPLVAVLIRLSHPTRLQLPSLQIKATSCRDKTVLFLQLHDELLPELLQLLTLFQPSPRALRLLWWLLHEALLWFLVHSTCFIFQDIFTSSLVLVT